MATQDINYTAFAKFLGSYPDILAVKRFRELQIRNLLFYQAELAHLEQELQEIEVQDVAATTIKGPDDTIRSMLYEVLRTQKFTDHCYATEVKISSRHLMATCFSLPI